MAMCGRIALRASAALAAYGGVARLEEDVDVEAPPFRSSGEAPPFRSPSTLAFATRRSPVLSTGG